MKSVRIAVLIAVLITLCFGVEAGPLSITLDTNGEQTLSRLSKALFEWSTNVIDETACSGDCCNTTTDQRCLSLAREVLNGRAKQVSSAIIPCIQKSVNFLCDWWVSEGQTQMVCETFPETESVVLQDVAICASQLAETRF